MTDQDRIKAMERALSYMVECAIVTVEGYALHPSRRKRVSEYKRHILIAQAGLDQLDRLNIPRSEPYTKRVIGTVKEWARSIEPL